MQKLVERIKRKGGGQKELDTIYMEMMDVMNSGLVQVRRKGKEEYKGQGQPWFTKKIAGQRMYVFP